RSVALTPNWRSLRGSPHHPSFAGGSGFLITRHEDTNIAAPGAQAQTVLASERACVVALIFKTAPSNRLTPGKPIVYRKREVKARQNHFRTLRYGNPDADRASCRRL